MIVLVVQHWLCNHTCYWRFKVVQTRSCAGRDIVLVLHMTGLRYDQRSEKSRHLLRTRYLRLQHLSGGCPESRAQYDGNGILTVCHRHSCLANRVCSRALQAEQPRGTLLYLKGVLLAIAWLSMSAQMHFTARSYFLGVKCTFAMCALVIIKATGYHLVHIHP